MNHRRTPSVGAQIASSRAFTLIELLVVISIISLLLALMLPSLSKARERSIELKCTAHVRSSAIAFTQYFQDYKYFLPPLNSNPAATGYNYGTWQTPTATYFPNPKTIRCPSSGDSFAMSWRQRHISSNLPHISRKSENFWNHSETALVFENAQYLDSIYFMRVRAVVSGEYDTAVLDLSSHNRAGISAAYYDGHAQFIPFTTAQTTSGTYSRTVPFLYRQWWGKVGHNLYTESGHCPF